MIGAAAILTAWLGAGLWAWRKDLILPDGTREIEETTGHALVRWAGYGALTAMSVFALSIYGGGGPIIIFGGGFGGGPGTEEVGGGGGDYPNLPAGMTLVTAVSHANLLWEGFNDPGPAWSDGSSGSQTLAIEDLTCPVGPHNGVSGDSATYIPKEAGSTGTGAMGMWLNQSPYNFTVDSMYVALYMYRDVSFSHSQKFYYTRHPNSNAAAYYDSSGGGAGNLRFVNQYAASEAIMSPRGAGTIPQNDWMLWETLFVAESSASADDGEFYFWKDGDLVFSNVAVNYAPSADPDAFAGMSWRGVSDDLFGELRWYKVCGVVVYGGGYT